MLIDSPFLAYTLQSWPVKLSLPPSTPRRPLNPIIWAAPAVAAKALMLRNAILKISMESLHDLPP